MSSLTIHDAEAKFTLGYSEDYAGISAVDVAFMQHVWRLRPQLQSVLELGTSWGVTALLLGVLARIRGGQCVSVDRQDIRPEGVRRAWLDNMTFLYGDLLAPGAPMLPPLAALLGNADAGPWLLICDGGDKLEELRRYAPLVAPGGVVMVHDFLPIDEPHTVCEANVAPIMDGGVWRRLEWDTALEWRSYFRAWERG